MFVSVDSVEFSMETIMPSIKSSTFFSSFLICKPFIYFSCLIALARNSRTTLMIVVRAGILTLILTGKHSVFHH